MGVRRRGFSLAEMLVSVAIIALVLSLSLVQLHGAKGGADSRALATFVAEQLRLARQSAVASQQPVGVLLPTQRGTRPTARALYLVSGLSMARITKVVGLTSDFPGAELFAGCWNRSGPSPVLFPRLQGARQSQFDAGRWLDNPNLSYDMTLDYALVFTPDGSVCTNGLPFFDGAFRLVACHGSTFQPDSVPATATPGRTTRLAYFQATGANQPWTICLTPSGQISLKSGLDGQDGSVAKNTGGLDDPGQLPPVLEPPPSQPVLQKATISPSPTTQIPGVNVTLAPGQRVSLHVEASDRSGRDLFLRWKCTPQSGNSGPANGVFSFAAPERMSWDESGQHWVSNWDWLAPQTAQAGDHFTFSCELGDGLTAQVMPNATQNVQTVASTKIDAVLWMNYKGFTNNYVVKANVDGSCPSVLVTSPLGGNTNCVSCTLDGSKIATCDGTRFQVFSGLTGGRLHVVSPANLVGDHAIISPLGNKIAYWGNVPGGVGLIVSNLDGTSPTTVHVDSACLPYWSASSSISWSNDQQHLSFISKSSTSGGAYAVHTVAPDGSNYREFIDGNTPFVSATRWAPNNQTLYLGTCGQTNAAGDFLNRIYHYSPTANALIQPNPVVESGGYAFIWGFTFDITPDGSKFGFLNGRGGSAYLMSAPVSGPNATGVAPWQAGAATLAICLASE